MAKWFVNAPHRIRAAAKRQSSRVTAAKKKRKRSTAAAASRARTARKLLLARAAVAKKNQRRREEASVARKKTKKRASGANPPTRKKRHGKKRKSTGLRKNPPSMMGKARRAKGLRKYRRNPPMMKGMKGLFSDVAGAALDAGIILGTEAGTRRASTMIPYGEGSVFTRVAKQTAVAIAISAIAHYIPGVKKKAHVIMTGALLAPMRTGVASLPGGAVLAGYGLGRFSLRAYNSPASDLPRNRAGSVVRGARPAAKTLGRFNNSASSNRIPASGGLSKYAGADAAAAYRN